VLPWLLPIIREVKCNHFVDVFGGSGVVMVNMDPAPIETYNDLNLDVVRFFRALRENPDELIRQLQLTPHSKYEYHNAVLDDEMTDLEAARRFFIRTQQSIHAAGAHDRVKGWSASIKESRVSMSEKTQKWLTSIEALWMLAERFRRIQIENRDFRFIMKSYDDPGTHFFCDPPYDSTFRSSTKYKFDFENQDFYELQYWSYNASARVTICGYDTPFMRDLFSKFTFRQGPKRKNGRSEKPAYECCWTNY
jgi:DNA adenine methylase